MNEATVKIFKRFIRCFSKMHDFLVNRFIIMHVKGKVDILDKMFERVNRSSWQCSTPLFDVCFECKDKQPASSILKMNFVLSEEFKKASSVLENGVAPLPSNFRFDKSLIIHVNTFKFFVLEKHVRVKIWEETI